MSLPKQGQICTWMDCRMSKRITIPITKNIDAIRAQIQSDMGIELTYAQTIDFLIHFYSTKKIQPLTQWRPIK